jgi:hypothetical protein
LRVEQQFGVRYTQPVLWIVVQVTGKLRRAFSRDSSSRAIWLLPDFAK